MPVVIAGTHLAGASGGSWRDYWRLLEAPGSSQAGGPPDLFTKHLRGISPADRLLEASGGFWRPLEASGMAVEPKSVKKALEFTAKLRFRASRNAVVAPEVVGE